MSVSEAQFRQAVADLGGLIETLPAEWRAIDSNSAARRPRPGAWSVKEVVGHLIDSAGVNLQRFLRARLEPGFSMLYPQDEFVALNAYQEREWADVITLWTALNAQVLHVAGRIPAADLDKPCGAEPADQDWTVGFRVVDYVAHIRHHLNQIERTLAQ